MRTNLGMRWDKLIVTGCLKLNWSGLYWTQKLFPLKSWLSLKKLIGLNNSKKFKDSLPWVCPCSLGQISSHLIGTVYTRCWRWSFFGSVWSQNHSKDSVRPWSLSRKLIIEWIDQVTKGIKNRRLLPKFFLFTRERCFSMSKFKHCWIPLYRKTDPSLHDKRLQAFGSMNWQRLSEQQNSLSLHTSLCASLWTKY